jgi:hypothetical protein
VQEKTRTRERAARKRGPAPFRPTVAQRRDAMLLMAGGIGEAGIAAIFQLSVNCLRKHFAHELLHGRAQKRAENLRRLEAAAQGGAVTAMRVLHLVYDKAEAQELHDVSDDDERRERAETAVLERPSKKALERRAALSAGEGTDWGTDLLPPADWRQPLSPP